MKYLVKTFGGILYHKVPFTILGFSGGCTISWFIDDFIPDKATHIYEPNNN